MGPEKTFICEPTLTRIFWPDLPDEVVEQLVGGKGRESVVHHPSHQVPQLVSEWNFKIYLWIENSLTVVPEFEPDSWFDLLQDLLPVVIEKLVHRVRQQLVLPVEQVVHVDYHLRIYV